MELRLLGSVKIYRMYESFGGLLYECGPLLYYKVPAPKSHLRFKDITAATQPPNISCFAPSQCIGVLFKGKYTQWVLWSCCETWGSMHLGFRGSLKICAFQEQSKSCNSISKPSLFNFFKIQKPI